MNKTFTCAGVETAVVAGAGVLGVTGVEAAEGWGLEAGTGCEEEDVEVDEEELTGWTGVLWDAFWVGAGASTRSTLLSWRAMLLEKDADI